MTDAMKESYRESMGLNDPAPVRYLNWMGNILKGDLGYSTSTGANIGTMIATRLPYTIELACWGVISATIIGVLTGFLAAIRKTQFSTIRALLSVFSVFLFPTSSGALYF